MFHIFKTQFHSAWLMKRNLEHNYGFKVSLLTGREKLFYNEWSIVTGFYLFRFRCCPAPKQPWAVQVFRERTRLKTQSNVRKEEMATRSFISFFVAIFCAHQRFAAVDDNCIHTTLWGEISSVWSTKQPVSCCG